MEQSQKMAMDVVEILQSKKARDIVKMDIQELTVISDYFIICDGSSTIQVKSLAEEIKEKMQKQGYRLLGREGHREGRWILLDYGNIIVHIFHKEDREFYNLERLWGDAQIEHINND